MCAVTFYTEYLYIYIYFIAFRTTPICSLNSVVQNSSISEMALHIE